MKHSAAVDIQSGPNLIAASTSELDIKTQSTSATTPTSIHDAKTLNDQNVYDTYLSRLSEDSEYSKKLTTSSTNNPPAGGNEHFDSKTSKPLSARERHRIRERYSEKAKERRLRMYEKAILVAEEREREEGKRYRMQRQLHFKIVYKTYYGQNVYVVGSASPLGTWDVEKAVPLTWCPENTWTGSVTLSGEDGLVEYKYIIKDTNTNKVTWESGYNHKVDVAKIGTTTTLDDTWGVAC